MGDDHRDIVLPADLAALTDEFRAIERDADDLLDGLNEDQFNWSPVHGRWSIGQCVEHLNVINGIYLQGIEEGIRGARAAGRRRSSPIAVTVFGRWFIGQMEPPATLRMRAPRTAWPANDRRHKAEVWPEFVRVHQHIRTIIADAADVDLNRATFVNPFIRWVRVRCGTGLRIIAAHDRRHLWQAQRLRETAGFPRS
jgi:hypothetical protein